MANTDIGAEKVNKDIQAAIVLLEDCIDNLRDAMMPIDEGLYTPYCWHCHVQLRATNIGRLTCLTCYCIFAEDMSVSHQAPSCDVRKVVAVERRDK